MDTRIRDTLVLSALNQANGRDYPSKVVQDSHYDNPAQPLMDIFKYIEMYYNTKRIHSALNWQSPVQFEAQND